MDAHAGLGGKWNSHFAAESHDVPAMEIFGMLLVVLGGALAFAFALALAFSRVERDGVSAFEWSDAFLFGGLLSFVRGLAKGVSDAFDKRKSNSFALAVGFVASALIAASGVLIRLVAD